MGLSGLVPEVVPSPLLGLLDWIENTPESATLDWLAGESLLEASFGDSARRLNKFLLFVPVTNKRIALHAHARARVACRVASRRLPLTPSLPLS